MQSDHQYGWPISTAANQAIRPPSVSTATVLIMPVHPTSQFPESFQQAICEFGHKQFDRTREFKKRKVRYKPIVLSTGTSIRAARSTLGTDRGNTKTLKASADKENIDNVRQEEEKPLSSGAPMEAIARTNPRQSNKSLSQT